MPKKKLMQRIKRKARRVVKRERRRLTKSVGIDNLRSVRSFIGESDNEHVWAFIAGQASQDFRGNPKYLFVYINYYRPDIKAYWICDDEETISQVRMLGFHAYTTNSVEAQFLINRTGVLVTEQVKYAMPSGFENVKYINLWHGVGFKTVERRLFDGDIAMGLARKYVRRGTFYRDNQLMMATCPIIEEEYATDVGVDYDKFLRVGYPRCLYQQNYNPIRSFDHDLLKLKGLPESTKMIVYAPTYRAKLGGTFSKANFDFDRLHHLCEEKDLLFIFKVHPQMEKETGFLKAWDKYGDKQRFWFWDNRNDFYEIMHKMDLAIVDYSGIISDMVAMGVPHYIRYLFDYEEYMQSVSIHDNYFEKTTGIVCHDFDELLQAIETYDQRDEQEEVEHLNQLLWSYSSGKEDFEKIINTTFDFNVQKRQFPTLYSFDIFDTIISRKVLHPHGIFYYVKEQMKNQGGFPPSLIKKYPEVRHFAEFNVREFYTKTKVLRNSEKTEITFDEIFNRIADVYNLSSEQVELLKQWEIEAELENVIPLNNQIDLIKRLCAEGEHVVLISDMYLPKAVIKTLLDKADPLLAELPLFLSNEYGVLKTSQKLFFEVYKSFEPYYDFKKWIHYGDNQKADIVQARKFEINTRLVPKPEYNPIQKDLVARIGTYDSYLIAAMQARLCKQYPNEQDSFVISYISLVFIPYVDWALRDALRKGYETLYFISRDGHHLKRIADAIIDRRGLNIKTKYIYASRRTWRIPSFIDHVDSGFWEPYGSFLDIPSKNKLYGAMDLDERQFRKLFPYIDPDEIDFKNKKEFRSLIEIFKNSKEYNEYLLNTAKKERELVCGYLEQEINFDEKYAFVEYYGRGYTQDCLVNLIHDITGNDDEDIVFYYSRTVLPSLEHSTRYNFTTNNSKQYFIESIFANMPYKSVQEYTREDDRIVPVISPIPYDKGLFDSMELLLPLVSKEYASLDLKTPEDTNRLLYDFVFEYYQDNKTNQSFAESIGHLVDAVALFGNKREFAPPLTNETLDGLETKRLSKGGFGVSTELAMSIARSEKRIQDRFFEMYQVLPGDPITGGRVLSAREQEDNRQYRKLYMELNRQSKAFSHLYKEYAFRVEVEKKILVLRDDEKAKSVGLDMVVERLKSKDEYHVETRVVNASHSYRDRDLAMAVATSKVIVISSSIGLLNKITFRDETKLIMLSDNAFPLFNQNLASNYFLKWKNKYMKMKGENDISVLQIPAESQATVLRQFYSNHSYTKTDLLGCNITDLYFDPAFIVKSRKKLINLFPEARGKKVLLYAPYAKTRNRCENWLDILDLEVLKERIGEEYVVVVHFDNPKVKGMDFCNVIDIPGFSKRIKRGISIRELMVASDVIVGNYRNSFYEAPLLHKPVFATMEDYESFIKKRNVSCRANDFEEFIFCPIVSSAMELADRLEHLNDYDYSKQEVFRKKILSGCDGKSTERAIDYIYKLMDSSVTLSNIGGE